MPQIDANKSKQARSWSKSSKSADEKSSASVAKPARAKLRMDGKKSTSLTSIKKSGTSMQLSPQRDTELLDLAKLCNSELNPRLLERRASTNGSRQEKLWIGNAKPNRFPSRMKGDGPIREGDLTNVENPAIARFNTGRKDSMLQRPESKTEKLAQANDLMDDKEPIREPPNANAAKSRQAKDLKNARKSNVTAFKTNMQSSIRTLPEMNTDKSRVPKLPADRTTLVFWAAMESKGPRCKKQRSDSEKLSVTRSRLNTTESRYEEDRVDLGGVDTMKNIEQFVSTNLLHICTFKVKYMLLMVLHVGHVPCPLQVVTRDGRNSNCQDVMGELPTLQSLMVAVYPFATFTFAKQNKWFRQL